MSDSVAPLTRKEAAAQLSVSTATLKRLIDAGRIKIVPPKGRVLPEALERFRKDNDKRCQTVRADILRAYDAGMDMVLVERVAGNSIFQFEPLLPAKQTTRQFVYQTIYKKYKEDT